jgi:hypothetical protein
MSFYDEKYGRSEIRCYEEKEQGSQLDSIVNFPVNAISLLRVIEKVSLIKPT